VETLAGMTAFQAILLALLRRGTTGLGGRADVSLLESALSVLTYHASSYLLTSTVTTASGSRSPRLPGNFSR
jgi:crotonobetainyl-CoA:carnitine CoA-transferase CaiB-like acyl-CoA transferase